MTRTADRFAVVVALYTAPFTIEAMTAADPITLAGYVVRTIDGLPDRVCRELRSGLRIGLMNRSPLIDHARVRACHTLARSLFMNADPRTVPDRS